MSAPFKFLIHFHISIFTLRSAIQLFLIVDLQIQRKNAHEFETKHH